MEGSNLSYGANDHQAASLSRFDNCIDYEILSHNKNIEYVDYVNLSEALRVLAEFFDVHACVVVNESNICSAALGSSVKNAFEKAVDCDPVVIIGATVGFSKEVGLDIAKQLGAMKVKNIMAPSYTKEAFSFLLETKINIIKINTPLYEVAGFSEPDIKVTPFGILRQEQNRSNLSKDSFTVVSQIKPTQQQVEDAIFAWKVAKHLKSKSVVVAKDLSAKAIVQGKTNFIVAVETAMDSACEYSKDAVLALDSVIENIEVINAAIQGRVGLILESGDGAVSQNIVKLADKYGLSLIFTKIRNNKY